MSDLRHAYGREAEPHRLSPPHRVKREATRRVHRIARSCSAGRQAGRVGFDRQRVRAIGARPLEDRMSARTKLSLATATALGLASLTAVVADAVAATPTPTTTATTVAADPPVLDAELIRSYDAFDANQGVAVDAKYFYAVDNRSITKHDRETGEPLLQIAGSSGGPLIHMDSGAVVGCKIYAAHSNYSGMPMQS
ncbi:MAG TPA: hypothetical protein VFR22_16050, partial [Nocardioidaceae bacterium]|nr:hypothetical protein [Nocardioidaceae bacterium]